MYYFVIGLIIVVSVILVLIVLVQNSKGGGLATNFSSSNQVMGVRKTTDFLEKATWVLAAALLVLSITASLTIPRDKIEAGRSAIEEQIQATNPTQMPSFPIDAPTGDGIGAGDSTGG